MATIQKRGEKWFVQVSKQGKRISASFHTKSEANAWARETQIDLDNAHKSRLKLYGKFSKLKNSAEYDEIVEAAIFMPSSSGIYFLILNDVITYIGQSKNVMTRIAEHARKGRKFTHISIIPCNEDDLIFLEKQYIEKFKPESNVS